MIHLIPRHLVSTRITKCWVTTHYSFSWLICGNIETILLHSHVFINFSIEISFTFRIRWQSSILWCWLCRWSFGRFFGNYYRWWLLKFFISVDLKIVDRRLTNFDLRFSCILNLRLSLFHVWSYLTLWRLLSSRRVRDLSLRRNKTLLLFSWRWTHTLLFESLRKLSTSAGLSIDRRGLLFFARVL